MQLTIEVFPAPLGPIIENNSPSLTPKLTSVSARTPPKRSDTPRTSKACSTHSLPGAISGTVISIALRKCSRSKLSALEALYRWQFQPDAKPSLQWSDCSTYWTIGRSLPSALWRCRMASDTLANHRIASDRCPQGNSWDGGIYYLMRWDPVRGVVRLLEAMKKCVASARSPLNRGGGSK